MSEARINARVLGSQLSLAEALQELERSPKAGGQCIFEGMIRNHNDGRSVERLEYECYEELALKEFKRIAQEAIGRFELTEVLVHHRKGPLDIGDTAVLVITLAHHRNEAFLGTRYVIDELKKRAPIWKKEFYKDGSHSWPRCSHHH